jgi:peroxiredoxin
MYLKQNINSEKKSGMKPAPRIPGLLTALILTAALSGQTAGDKDINMRLILSEAKLVNVEGDTLTYLDITSDRQLVALFFCFNGCTGCKISIKETLYPNHEMLKKRYGLEIMVISKEEGAGRQRAAVEYSGYPFRLLFDMDNALFAAMPPGLYDNGKRMKAWPTLVLVDSEFHYCSANPFSIEQIENSILEINALNSK